MLSKEIGHSLFIAALPPQPEHGWKQLHVYLQVDGEAAWVPSMRQDGFLSLEVLSDVAPCTEGQSADSLECLLVGTQTRQIQRWETPAMVVTKGCERL